MPEFFLGPGFLGTRARLYADIAVVGILISAILFTVGWRLAVGRRLALHQWIQTAAATLNTVVVLTFMVISFVVYILPGVPGKLLEGTYGITTVHAFIGTLSLLLGVFVVLRAYGFVPERLRFRDYKPFMRTSYGLYMLSTAIGVLLYILVYAVGTG